MALESFRVDDLTSAQLQEVEEFLDSQETGHPFQFPQWLDPGSKVMLLRESGKICWMASFGVHPPLGRKVPWIRAAVVNRGPVCDDLEMWEAASDELAGELRREGVAFFDASPEWIQQPAEESPSFLKRAQWKSLGGVRASLRLDLTPSAEDLFANFAKTTRYEVRRAERMGAVVSAASNDADIDQFLGLYEGLAARKGFPADSAERMRREIHWLMTADSRGALLLAKVNDAVCGGAVIGRAGRRCWYIWGANEKGQVNVGHIVQWHALQWAKSRACSEYDFGGYTPGATSGPAWFKAGFGGAVVHFVVPYRRVIRRAGYRVYRLLSRIR
jgi:lipid II:glycine glycyltransferase (peptidoglycan interpeptide bridge formation enzyme)